MTSSAKQAGRSRARSRIGEQRYEQRFGPRRGEPAERPGARFRLAEPKPFAGFAPFRRWFSSTSWGSLVRAQYRPLGSPLETAGFALGRQCSRLACARNRRSKRAAGNASRRVRTRSPSSGAREGVGSTPASGSAQTSRSRVTSTSPGVRGAQAPAGHQPGGVGAPLAPGGHRRRRPRMARAARPARPAARAGVRRRRRR